MADDTPDFQVSPVNQPDPDPPGPLIVPGSAPRAEAVGQQDPQQPQQQQAGATPKDLAEWGYQQIKKADANIQKSNQFFESMRSEEMRLLQEQEKFRQANPMPELMTYPKMPDPNGDKQKNLKAILGYSLLAIPIAIAFGGKHGSGMAAFANGLQAVQHGNQEGAKENYALWREQVTAVHEANKEREDHYKAVMADRNSTVTEKIAIIKDMAETYKDETTAQSADLNDLKSLTQTLENLQKLNKDAGDNVINKLNAIGKFFGTEEGSLYQSDAAGKYPRLAAGLYSNNPDVQTATYMELQKIPGMRWYDWHVAHLRELNPTATEKDAADTAAKKPPHIPYNPGKLDEQTKDNIRKLSPDTIGPLPKPGSPEPAPRSRPGSGKEYNPHPGISEEDEGFDPSRPFG